MHTFLQSNCSFPVSTLLVQASNLPPLSSVGRLVDVARSITHDCINDLRARTEDTVDTALRHALGKLKDNWSPKELKDSRVPTFLEVTQNSLEHHPVLTQHRTPPSTSFP